MSFGTLPSEDSVAMRLTSTSAVKGTLFCIRRHSISQAKLGRGVHTFIIGDIPSLEQFQAIPYGKFRLIDTMANAFRFRGRSRMPLPRSVPFLEARTPRVKQTVKLERDDMRSVISHALALIILITQANQSLANEDVEREVVPNVVTPATRSTSQKQISLDGLWDFHFSPDERGEKEQWFSGRIAFPHRLEVPGCWDAQGIGQEHERVRNNAVGVGWYRRSIALPKEWEHGRVWLKVGGAHRSAQVWVNGNFVGEHWGFPVPFKFDVTDHLVANKDQQLVIAVDSRWHKDRDMLVGASDMDEAMHVDWGGIFAGITLEATGDIWVEDAFVIPDPAKSRARVQIELGKIESTSFDNLSLSYTVRQWRKDKRESLILDKGTGRIDQAGKSEWALHLKDAPLWSPEEPNLLLLEMTLSRDGRKLEDHAVRFGQRKLEIRDGDFYLNGERFYYIGYGEDWTFPVEGIGGDDLETWCEYLRFRKQFGFNGNRNHSTMPMESYLDAADEVGMFVQPELPIEYPSFFNEASDQAKELYRDVWRDYIKQMRNHPSVFGWGMGNEIYRGFAMGEELYDLAKEVDPTRPVIDSDGLYFSIGGFDRKSLDYLTILFEEKTKLPWAKGRDKYTVDPPQTKPVIGHEINSLVTLPNPADIPKYTGMVKPNWISKMDKAVKDNGLEEHLPKLLDASWKLQASQIKLNVEMLRMNGDIDGHHQWLFRDFWYQSGGIVNQFDEVRALTPRMARRFFASAVLSWDRDRVNYYAGDAIELRIFLSDYRHSSAKRIRDVRVQIGDQTVLLDRPAETGGRGVIGPWTGSVKTVDVDKPQKLLVTVTAGSAEFGFDVENEWPTWIFPRVEETTLDPQVHVVRRLNRNAIDWLESGDSVLVLDSSMNFRPTDSARYKLAWWDSGNGFYGNMVSSHPAMKSFPNDGYGDLQMYNLLNERPVVLLDQLPGKIDPIVWNIDYPWQMRRMAYLFEANVGKGRLLVNTMDVSPETRQKDPAAEWLLHGLTNYVASEHFQPSASIPLDWIRQHAALGILPDNEETWMEGFGKVLESTESTKWHSYREKLNSCSIVRGTDGKQIVRWKTPSVRQGFSHDRITFVFAGGIGWRTQPEMGPFSLEFNGKPLLDFPWKQSDFIANSRDGLAKLRYSMFRQDNEDCFGVFFLTVPAALISPGKPVELAVSARQANDSKRFFLLNNHKDVVRDLTDKRDEE